MAADRISRETTDALERGETVFLNTEQLEHLLVWLPESISITVQRVQESRSLYNVKVEQRWA